MLEVIKDLTKPVYERGVMPQQAPENLPSGFTNKDFDLIREMREQGVLADVVPEEFRAVLGTVLVLCSDGDRICDSFDHHRESVGKGNFPVRPHMIAYPGAPILLSRHSPELLGMRIDRLLIAGIKSGPEMKNIKTVVTVPHWPCGQAKACNIDLLRALELAMNGKARLRKDLAGHVHEIVTCLHVDYGNTMKTYHVNQTRWLRFITTKKHGEQYPVSLYLNSMPL